MDRNFFRFSFFPQPNKFFLSSFFFFGTHYTTEFGVLQNLTTLTESFTLNEKKERKKERVHNIIMKEEGGKGYTFKEGYKSKLLIQKERDI